jgi:hypothetical protein
MTWLINRTDYSHSYHPPITNDYMSIIKNSPNLDDDSKPFDIYIYKTVNVEKSIDNHRNLYLELIEIKKVVFNKETKKYQFFIKENLITKLKKLLP